MAAQYDEFVVPEERRRIGEELPNPSSSIDRVRNPYVDPVNLVQRWLSCRLRQRRPDERLLVGWSQVRS